MNLKEFSQKWLGKFQDPNVNYIELVDHYFADDCEALGFIMDCGNSFSMRYGKAVSNVNELIKVIDEVNDIKLLGSALYSQWRYYNHWAYTGAEIVEPENREWFLVALRRMEKLSDMSSIELINASCADQTVDAVVNAANNRLWAGGGICGVIFRKAGVSQLQAACSQYTTPLRDGTAVITPAFNLKNAKYIIHAVGPDFARTPTAFEELFSAYYNSLCVLKDNDLHSISFPLISSGIFGGALNNPVAESTKQCCRAYRKFVKDFPEYKIEVKLCAFSSDEMNKAQRVFDSFSI